MNKQIICISVLIASLTVTVSAQTSMEELTANPAKSREATIMPIPVRPAKPPRLQRV